MEDQRLLDITQWARSLDGLAHGQISVASADASFRRYFRITDGRLNYILMDAPPDKEDTAPFIDVTQRLEAQGLPVPHIHAKDDLRGFLMLDDFGSLSLLRHLKPINVDHWYGMALDLLLPLQCCDTSELPHYDDAMLMREMDLFREWFLEKHLALTLEPEDKEHLDMMFSVLATNALEQPTAFVHRDFHSRNLMVVDGQSLGIIDYQDAVLGPITYDAVSLLKDCYIDWPPDQTVGFVLGFKQRLLDSGRLNKAIDDETFLRWFDMMGTQRHLKAIGIFARLNHRDDKPGYLADIPRTLQYVLDVAQRYPSLTPLHKLLCQYRVVEQLTQ